MRNAQAQTFTCTNRNRITMFANKYDIISLATNEYELFQFQTKRNLKDCQTDDAIRSYSSSSKNYDVKVTTDLYFACYTTMYECGSSLIVRIHSSAPSSIRSVVPSLLQFSAPSSMSSILSSSNPSSAPTIRSVVPSLLQFSAPSSMPSILSSSNPSSAPKKTSKLLRMEFMTDLYPLDTSWIIEDMCTNSIVMEVTQGEYVYYSTLFTKDKITESSKFKLTIKDSHGDGICCDQGRGSYDLTYGNTLVLSSRSDPSWTKQYENEFGDNSCAPTISPAPSLSPSTCEC